MDRHCTCSPMDRHCTCSPTDRRVAPRCERAGPADEFGSLVAPGLFLWFSVALCALFSLAVYATE
eukprot:4754506-Prymnesium_polylepis.1